MRVAFIVPQLRQQAGWRSMCSGAIRSLHTSRGVQPIVIVSAEDTVEAQKLFPFAQVESLPAVQRDLSNFQPYARLQLALRRRFTQRLALSVDLVHSLAAYPTGLVGDWLSKRYQVPHIISIAGTYGVLPAQVPHHKHAYLQVLERASAICPISNGTAAIVQQRFTGALAPEKVHVIWLGTDDAKKVPQAVALARTLSGRPTVLSVGGIKPRKGYHIALQAFAQLKASLPSAQYVIIGGSTSSRYQEQLRSIIDDLKIGRDVHFRVGVSNEALAEEYRRAWVFTLASQQIGDEFEGFGLVFLEAGSYGVPVVGTNTGGIPDAVEQGVTGFLVQQNDIEGLAKAMFELLTNHSLNLQMGRANRIRAEQFTWDRYATQQFSVYEKVLTSQQLKSS